MTPARMNIRSDGDLRPAQGDSYGEQLHKVISALEIQAFHPSHQSLKIKTCALFQLWKKFRQIL